MMANPVQRSQTLRLPLHVPVAVLFSLLILGVGATISLRHFHDTRVLLDGANHALFQNLADETRDRLYGANDAVRRIFVLLSASALADAPGERERLLHLAELTGLIGGAPLIESIVVGYGDGDLFLVRRARQAELAEGASWIVMDAGTPSGSERQARELRFDADLRLLEAGPATQLAADPRLADWYRQAAASNVLVVTPARAFAHGGGRGPTFAQRNGATVFGVNLDLDAMATLIGSKLRTASTSVWLLSHDHQLLTDALHPQARQGVPDDVVRRALAQYRDVAQVSRQIAAADARQWHVSMAPMPGFADHGWILAVATPDEEIFAAAYEQRQRSIRFTIVAVLLSFPLAWALSRLLTTPLHRLADHAHALSALQFNSRSKTHSVILEVDELADAMALMSRAISRFVEIGRRLGSAPDLAGVLEQLELGAREVSGASFASVCVWNDDAAAHAGPALAHNIHARDPHGLLAPPWAELAHEAEAPFSFRRGESEDAPVVICVPLRTSEGDALGALALAGLPAESLAAAAAEITGFLHALAATAAVALENQRLLEGRRALLHGVIRMVAGAIDAKSPYTGGHCQRVPLIALRLARAADASDDPALRDFKLSATDWEALEIAAWLHDCGKLTSPEFVIDKATKLETLYNRIHEIRTRFEVLKRDAELRYWRGLVGGGDEADLRAARDHEWQTLDEEFAFVAECNHGSENMPASAVERLHRIAQRQWTRTLDDRLGLSWEELARHDAQPAATLPAQEALLQDRAHHIIARSDHSLYEAGNAWGFTMKPPANLYNHGELYNLSTRRGTLSAEERFKVREHIVETVIMLSRLPFPRDLAGVPEMACAHHETMDGRGYPRGLRAGQMSGPARAMAIADIYEALTASDRPYRTANTISEALALMRDMASRQVIDADLFALFERERLWADAPTEP